MLPVNAFLPVGKSGEDLSVAWPRMAPAAQNLVPDFVHGRHKVWLGLHPPLIFQENLMPRPVDSDLEWIGPF